MLSPTHKSALLSTFLHIESRLSEMEPLLAQGKRSSPLSQHVSDLSPGEAKAVAECFARIRNVMLTCLEKHGIPLEVRRVSLRWALQTNMMSLSAAVDEVGPERLRGCGNLDEAGRQEVLSIQQELEPLVGLLRKVSAICSG